MNAGQLPVTSSIHDHSSQPVGLQCNTLEVGSYTAARPRYYSAKLRATDAHGADCCSFIPLRLLFPASVVAGRVPERRLSVLSLCTDDLSVGELSRFIFGRGPGPCAR